MDLVWKSLKPHLDENLSLAYVDDEGSEIPIDSACELQEALRISRTQGNRLKIILKNKNLNDGDLVRVRIKKTAQTAEKSSTDTTKTKSKDKRSERNENREDESTRANLPEPQPEVIHPLKKSKEKFLGEVNSCTDEPVHNSTKTENKVMKEKLDNGEKIHNQVSEDGADKRKVDVATQTECVSKDGTGDAGTLSKSKSDDRNSPANVASVRKDSNERVETSPRDWEKLHREAVERATSAIFLSGLYDFPDTRFDLPPGGSFATKVVVRNVGSTPFKCAKLVCLATEGVTLVKFHYSLGPLQPGERTTVPINGSVPNKIGLYRVQCQLYDELNEVCPPFVCKLVVSHGTDDDVRSFNAIIDDSHKTILKNIDEIQRNLERIDLLQANSSNAMGESRCDKTETKPTTTNPNRRNDGETVKRVVSNGVDKPSRTAEKEKQGGGTSTHNAKLFSDETGTQKSDESDCSYSRQLNINLVDCDTGEFNIAGRLEPNDVVLISMPLKTLLYGVERVPDDDEKDDLTEMTASFLRMGKMQGIRAPDRKPVLDIIDILDIVNLDKMSREVQRLQQKLNDIRLSKERPNTRTTDSNVPKERPTIPTTDSNIPKERPNTRTTDSNVPKERPTIPTTNSNIPKERPNTRTTDSNVPKERPSTRATGSNVPKERPQIRVRDSNDNIIYAVKRTGQCVPMDKLYPEATGTEKKPETRRPEHNFRSNIKCTQAVPKDRQKNWERPLGKRFNQSLIILHNHVDIHSEEKIKDGTQSTSPPPPPPRSPADLWPKSSKPTY